MRVPGAHTAPGGGCDMADPSADRVRVVDLIDLHEGRLGVPLLDDAGIGDVLRSARRIAVVGASPDPARPSNGVLRQLRDVGYVVVPVNPAHATVEGLTCYPDLRSAIEASGPVDIVDVFRRSDQCVVHAREAVEIEAGCLWLQLGVVSREAGRIAADGGLKVVMDRCTIIEYHRIALTIHPDRNDRETP